LTSGSVAAAVDELLPDAFGGAMRADAAAAAVPVGVGTAGGGGDFRERLVERQGDVL